MKNEELQEELQKIDGNVSLEQIENWKKSYRRVCSVEITDDNEIHIGYFKRPNMETLAAVTKLGKTDEIKAANALFENCFLGGSNLLKEDAVIKLAAVGKLNELMNITRGELKNL